MGWEFATKEDRQIALSKSFLKNAHEEYLKEKKYWTKERLKKIENKYFVLKNKNFSYDVYFYSKINEIKFLYILRTRFLSCFQYSKALNKNFFTSVAGAFEYYADPLPEYQNFGRFIQNLSATFISLGFWLKLAYDSNRREKQKNFRKFLEDGWDFASEKDKQIAFTNIVYRRIYTSVKGVE